jgi:DNA-binding transcriptional LysR family regulator
VTFSDSPFADRDSVSWAEVGRIPLCLLTPDMQNRRIIDQLLTSSGAEAAPTLESNSVIALFAHVRTGRWASILSEKLVETLGLIEPIRSIPIIDPQVVHQIGLVVPYREPMAPLAAALYNEAKSFSETKSFDAVQNNLAS